MQEHERGRELTTGPEQVERSQHAIRLLLSEFRERVLADPGKPAVVDGDRTLTYRELDAWSSSVAHGLLAAPPTAQPVVAIASWLGAETIALQQAVLKAGLVLAPLDPREPDEVLLAGAERLGARLILPDPERAAGLAPSGPRSAVTTPGELDSGVTTPPEGAFDPRRPIFLGATSGSTGRSRSAVFPPSITEIMNEVRLVHSADARVGIMLPPMFVAANGPVTSSWRSGATAYCYDLSSRPVAELPSWMESVGLTAFALTPSLVRMIFEPWLEQERPLLDVTRVTLTGETLTGNDVQVLRRVFPNATFVNVYGAADAALVSRFEIPPGLEVPDGPVSAGRPVRPVEILDDAGEPVPPGEVGVITAVGDWLPMVVEVEGPLDLAALDLARVRKAPTGDLGRLLLDGTLELLGRADHRVKVRGQMVDPNRVEAALVGLPELHDAIVSAVERDGTTTLVAHVIPATEPAPRPRDLRRALRTELPPFMVPSVFVVVSELPRLATGKADRLALRSQAAGAMPERPPSAAPSGATEEIVAAAFCQVLGLESVGRDDDFFDLGGDSLSAVELMTALESTFGVAVEGSTIVEHPTVGGLAAWSMRCEVAHRPSSGRPVARWGTRPVRDGGRRIVTLRSGGSHIPIYAVPGGGNNLFQLQPLAAALQDRPLHQFVPKGLDARTWPNYTVGSMARRYVEAMGPDPGRFVLAGYSFGAVVAWQMAQELAAAGRSPACLVLLDPSGFGRPRRLGDQLRELGHGMEQARAANTGAASAHPGGPRRRRAMARVKDERRAAGVVLARARHVSRLIVPPLTLGVTHHDRWSENRRFLDVSRYAAYRFAARPLGGSVVLVTAGGRPVTCSEECASVRELSTGDLVEVTVPGDHHGFLRPPHVRVLADQLDGLLP